MKASGKIASALLNSAPARGGGTLPHIFVALLISFLGISLAGAALAADIKLEPGKKKKCEKVEFKSKQGFGKVEIGELQSQRLHQ